MARLERIHAAYPWHWTNLRGRSRSALWSFLDRDEGNGIGVVKAALSFFLLSTLALIHLRICMNRPVCFKRLFLLSAFFLAPLINRICNLSVQVLILQHIGRSDSKCFQGVYNCTQGKEIEDIVKINLSFCITVSSSN